jgi:hypothetical protein
MTKPLLSSTGNLTESNVEQTKLHSLDAGDEGIVAERLGEVKK